MSYNHHQVDDSTRVCAQNLPCVAAAFAASEVQLSEARSAAGKVDYLMLRRQGGIHLSCWSADRSAETGVEVPGATKRAGAAESMAQATMEVEMNPMGTTSKA